MITKTLLKKRNVVILPHTDMKTEKIINYIMKEGKKTIARKIYEKAMDEIRNQWHATPGTVVDTAIENASPQIMVKSKRIWWSVYSIPLEVKPEKKFYFAIKRMLDAAKGKKWKPMYKKLAEEILASYTNTGSAIKKKEEVHKMAEANKAYSYMAKYVK